MARVPDTRTSNIIDLLSSDDDDTQLWRPKTSSRSEVVVLSSEDDDGDVVPLVAKTKRPFIPLKRESVNHKHEDLIPKSTCATEGCSNPAKFEKPSSSALCKSCLTLRDRKHEVASSKDVKSVDLSIQSGLLEFGGKRKVIESFEVSDTDDFTRPSKRINLGASVHGDPDERSTHEKSSQQADIDNSESSRVLCVSQSNSLSPSHSHALGQDRQQIHVCISNSSTRDERNNEWNAVHVAKRVKMGIRPTSPTPGATSLLKASSVSSSKSQDPKEIVTKTPSLSLYSDKLEGVSFKGKAKLVDNSIAKDSFSTQATLPTAKTRSATEEIRQIPLLVAKERNSLIKSELDKCLPVNFEIPPQHFIDSQLSRLASIEVSGKSLETAITSLAARCKKISSVPFMETKCRVQKVPAFKNFEFIKRNVTAADSRVLRFRRFDTSANANTRHERLVAEKLRYEIVLEPEVHMRTMRIAEDYASLYKHIPAILRTLGCTEGLLSEVAKKKFAKVFRVFGSGSKLDLQTLVNCRGISFDCVPFIPDSQFGNSRQSEDNESEIDPLYLQPGWEEMLEPLSSHSQYLCPLCHVFQCGNHGEPSDGDLNSNLSFKSHWEVLYRKQRSNTSKIVFDPNNVCSPTCYRSKSIRDEPTPWTPREIDLLGALTSMTEISPCLLRTALGKDCYDVHKHLLPLQQKERLLLESGRKDQDDPKSPLSWYDSKTKILKWKNPAESRGTTKETSIHRHAEMPRIKPCSHRGTCSDSGEGCHPRGLCNKFCLCREDCHLRFTGCNCLGPCTTDKCPCNALGFECDPDLCKSCGSKVTAHPRYKYTKPGESNLCQNVALQRAATPRVAIGQSTFEGWGYGLFAAEDIPRGTFIGEYCGEILSNDEADRRGIIYEEYFFTLNSETSIDATRKGNHMRFVNGTFPGDPLENCQAKILSVLGEHRIGFYASKTIKAGCEIFMDYGKDYEEKHQHHSRRRRENPKTWTLGNFEGQISIVVDDDTPVPVINRSI